MIEIKTIMSLAFLKKEHFSGSSQGMRYRLEKKERRSGLRFSRTLVL